MMIGQVYKQYKIVEKIGEGGMGVVYKAIDTRLDRPVSLKFLSAEFTRDATAKERFLIEAQAASALDHQNICTIHEIAETPDGRMYIVMAWYDGESLREKMQRGRLPRSEALSIAEQIATGLSQAHSKGIIHRDIKPENIIITSDGVVKIIDFGLAKLRDRGNVTQLGTTAGTIAYMAPEQARGEEVDRRVDIWALGVVMYELLLGQLPFRGEYEQAVIYSILNESPEGLDAATQEISAGLAQILVKALQKQPADRYEQVDELLEALHELDRPAVRAGRLFDPALLKTPRGLLFGLGLAAAILLSLFLLPREESGNGTAVTNLMVVPFTIQGADSSWVWLRSGMADLIKSNLERNPQLNLISAQQQFRLMQTLGLRGNALSSQQALSLARRARADKLLRGDLTIAGSELTLQLQLIDVLSGKIKKRPSQINSTLNAVYALADAGADAARKGLHLRSPTTSSSEKALAARPLDAQRYYIEGLNAAFEMEHMESINKLSHAIALDSTFIKPYYYLAWQYSLLRDFAKAKMILQKGKPLIRNLSEKERLQFLCNEASIDQRWHDYSKYLQRIAQLDPNDAYIRFLNGWVQYYVFRMPEAGIKAIEKSVELDSSYGFAFNTLAFAYLVSGRGAEALEAIDRVIAQSPTDVNYKDSKAEILAMLGRYREAREICQDILGLKRDYQTSPLTMARSYLAEGRLAEAQQTIENYTLQYGTPASVSNGYVVLAGIAWARLNMEQAILLATKAIDIQNDNLEAYWLRGWLQAETGALDQAQADLDFLDHTFEKDEGLQQHWLSYHLRGEMALRRGDPRQAVEQMTRALALFPKNRALYLNALGRAWKAANENEKAVEAFRMALAFNPNDAPSAAQLAILYHQNGNKEQSQAFTKQCVEIWKNADADFAPARSARGQLAASVGSSEK